MKVTRTALPEVRLIEPNVLPDARGHFYESWQRDRYSRAGVGEVFVQDNVSQSVRGTLRGLHFQEPRAQGKLVSVLFGRIFDVAVDIRRGSPRFGQWVGVTTDANEPTQVWIPPGFAHGFCVLSETATFLYKCTEFYSPETERSIRWDDPEIAIEWPISSPILSDKDASAPLLSDVAVLPEFRINSGPALER